MSNWTRLPSWGRTGWLADARALGMSATRRAAAQAGPPPEAGLALAVIFQSRNLSSAELKKTFGSASLPERDQPVSEFCSDTSGLKSRPNAAPKLQGSHLDHSDRSPGGLGAAIDFVTCAFLPDAIDASEGRSSLGKVALPSRWVPNEHDKLRWLRRPNSPGEDKAGDHQAGAEASLHLPPLVRTRPTCSALPPRLHATPVREQHDQVIRISLGHASAMEPGAASPRSLRATDGKALPVSKVIHRQHRFQALAMLGRSAGQAASGMIHGVDEDDAQTWRHLAADTSPLMKTKKLRNDNGAVRTDRIMRMLSWKPWRASSPESGWQE